MSDATLPNDRVKEVLRKLFRPGRQETKEQPAGHESGAGLDLSPRSPFDLLLDQRLKALEAQVDELKGRVNGLMALVVGAVVVQIVLGLFK